MAAEELAGFSFKAGDVRDTLGASLGLELPPLVAEGPPPPEAEMLVLGSLLCSPSRWSWK